MPSGERGASAGGGAGRADGHPRPRPSRAALERSEVLSGTATWEWDLKTDRVLWSDNLFRLLGLEPGAIEPTPDEVARRTHPDDRRRLEDEIQAARQARRPPEAIFRVIRPDGTTRVLRAATAVEGPHHGRPSRLVGSLHDLTALVAAEHERLESLTLLEAMEEAAPIGFAFVDREMRFVRVNEALAKTAGLAPDDFVGRTVAELEPGLWPQLEPVFSEVLERGVPRTNVEMSGEGRSGETGYYLVSHYPVRIDGVVTGVGIVVVDISERQEADRLRAAVMDTMMDGLCVLDREGRLSFMNAAASRILGWSEEELRGRNMHEAVHFQRADGSRHPIEECELMKVRKEARPVRISSDAFTCKDGTIVPVSYSAAPLLRGSSVRGVVVVFRDSSAEAAAEEQAQRELDQLAWIGRIRDALDEERLTLYSQPIVPLGDRDSPSQELLLRMRGRNGEVVLPGTFLPVAERYGLIGDIDRWVIGEAIRVAAAGERVEANLSGESIGNLDLVPLIARYLEETGADPTNVVFEITETALMRDAVAGEEFARRLTDLGCQVALDDFGTGFGSFTYLKKIPLTYLKIDVDFVADLTGNPANQHLVKAIVGLAQDFGYKTIAEGVEDAETMELLRGYGVDFAQGYHLGRPAPIPRRR